MLWKIFRVVFRPVIPIILLMIWLTMESWGPRLFGAKLFYHVMNRGVFYVGVGVLLAFLIVWWTGPLLKPMMSFFGGSLRTRRIRRTGRPATAVVKHIGENSQGGVITVNNQPYLNLVLEVNDGFQAPYEVSLDTVVPRVAVPQLQPGAVITVRVDPADPAAVAIVW